MINEVKGNLLETNCDYICHQVNCKGVMNSGVAKAIRTKWPEVYRQYVRAYYNANGEVEELLGEIQEVEISPCQSVINMFAQASYGYDGRRYTSYDAFWSCLNYIKIKAKPKSTIAFPDHIGCCRGGANWRIIRTMIEEVLGNDYDVYIYKLEEN